MSEEWENIEPSPIEFFHAQLIKKFHEWRRLKTEHTVVEIDGAAFNDLIAKVKLETYAKYSKQNLDKPIPKSEM